MDFETVKSRCTDALKKLTEDKVKVLFDLWKDIGVTNLESRADVILESVEHLLNGMIEEVSEHQESLIADIESLLQETAEIYCEVGGNLQNTINDQDENLSLMQLKTTLNERMEHLKTRKKERIHEYELLLEIEEKLHQSIGLEKREKITGVPKSEELEDFSSYISEKVREEHSLTQQFQEIKRKIKIITSELELSPETSLHRMLVSDTPICLSPKNLKLLKKLHHSLKGRLNKAESEAHVLQEQLLNLQKRLKVDNAEHNQTLQLDKCHLKKKIDILKTEIMKYEGQEKQNIGAFIDAKKKDIASLWEMCHYGELQRQKFHSYNSDCYTEELLEILEGEVQKLKSYFRENIDILDLAKKRETLWKRKLDLNGRSTDPHHLFDNHGGQVLKVENEQKALNKKLSNIDKKLNILLDAYDKKHNMPFQYNDCNLSDIIKPKQTISQKKNGGKPSQKNGSEETGLATKSIVPSTSKAT